MNLLMPRELERMFLDPFRLLGEERDVMLGTDWLPAVDVKEEKELYVLKVELPEMKKEDVKITIEKGVLTISGERLLEKEEEGVRFHRIERKYGSFLRSFVLPENVIVEKIDALFVDGILTIKLPKSAEVRPTVVNIDVH